MPLKIIDSRKSFDMKKISSDGIRDYFEVNIDLDMICLRYFFEIEDYAGEKVYFGNDSFFDEKPSETGDMFDCPQSLREEGYPQIPDWLKGKVLYQIFPSRFATSKNVDDKLWYKKPVTAQDRLYGDLKGIISKLGYLKDLGIDIIYLTPVFDSDTQHHYDTVDYYSIFSDLGTKEDLKELVKKAHQNNMYVILDGAFNHTSTRFFAFDDIIRNGEKSKYRNWYFIDSFPVRFGSKRSLPGYKTFAYYGPMPKLNLTDRDAADYVTKVVCHYLKEFDIDGWRLDVADEIGHLFWKNLRLEVKKIKPNAILIGEDWHICGDFLEGDEWDSCMNYPFGDSVRKLFREDGSISEFMNTLGKVRGRYHSNVFPVLLNHIGTHDIPRFLSSSSGKNDERRLILAAALQFLLPGIPFVYYGDEVGMTGNSDPDNRRGMVWDEKRINRMIIDSYRSLIRFRHENEKLWCDLPEIILIDEQERILVLRQDMLVMVFNFSENVIDLDQIQGFDSSIIKEGTKAVFRLFDAENDRKLNGFDAVVYDISDRL